MGMIAAQALLAQTAIRVQAPNVVAADEQFNVTFIIEGESSPSTFEWAPGDDFQLVWGPQRGSSSSVSIVNGKSTRSSQTTYTYVLMPRKTGTFEIPPATAVVKGKTLNSAKTSIEVVSGGASSQGGNSSSSSSSGGNGNIAATGDIADSDLFLRLTLSRTSVVVGEPITATLKLYQRVNIAGLEDAKFPSFNGFWSQEVAAPSSIEFKRESYNDMIYNAALLRTWTLIPQQAGTLRIDPAELVCLVNVRTASTPGSIFDSFFMDDYRTVRKRVYSSAFEVRVSPLPAGAPASFHGGVGNFTMDVALSRDSLKAHDAASLKVTVSGSGNVALLEAPTIQFPPDFEVYDMKTTESSGSKSFEFPFIPRSHGEFTLDPVEYSYYDIRNRKYVTLRSEPMTLRVAPGAGGEAAAGGTLIQGSNRKDVKDLGSDIRFIKTGDSSFTEAGSFFVGSAGFWAAVAALVAAAAAAWAALQRRAARRADVAGARNRAATKMARRRLAQAGDFLSKNLYTAFYEELHKALQGFIADKLTMDLASMNKDNIAAALRENGVSDSIADEFTSLLDACEYARYSPSSGHEAMDAHYQSALSVITAIDSSMKPSRHTRSDDSRHARTDDSRHARPDRASGGPAALLALLLFLSPAALSRAADRTAYPDSLWTAGVEAYTAGQWDIALNAWNGIAALGLESCELYYNIGNAYSKTGDWAHAILNYERARRLDPSDRDVAHNLAFANEMIQDRIEEVPEFFLVTWARSLCRELPSDTWAVLFLVLLAAALALAVVFFLGRARGGAASRAAFFSGIAALLLALMCLGFASWQKSDYIHDNAAIVVRAVASVKSSPSTESAKDLFVLHEGTKVRILDQVGDWNNIELADGRQGWLRRTDLEQI